jgi:hypothetical protein
MKSAAKRKPKPELMSANSPSLKQRAEALLVDLLSAPTSEQREVLTLWRDALDKALDDIAQGLAPKGKLTTDAMGQPAIVGAIPSGWIRNQIDIRGGHCHCRSLVEALKDS